MKKIKLKRMVNLFVPALVVMAFVSTSSFSSIKKVEQEIEAKLEESKKIIEKSEKAFKEAENQLKNAEEKLKQSNKDKVLDGGRSAKKVVVESIRESFESSTKRIEKKDKDEVDYIAQIEKGIEEGIKRQALETKTWDFKSVDEITKNKNFNFKKGVELTFKDDFIVEWAYLSVFNEGYKSAKKFGSKDAALKNALDSSAFVEREDFVLFFKAGFDAAFKDYPLIDFENARSKISGYKSFVKNPTFAEYIEGFKHGFNSGKAKHNSSFAFQSALMQGFKTGHSYSSAFKKGFDDGLFASKESLDFLLSFANGVNVDDPSQISVFKDAWSKSGLRNNQGFYTDKDGSKTFFSHSYKSYTFSDIDKN